jgi:hypothetical protein
MNAARIAVTSGAAAMLVVWVLATGRSDGARPGPVLCFSDLVGGPNSGSTESSPGGPAAGDGAIVTVWGFNLGTGGGDDKLYCNGAEASFYYYWGPAMSAANLASSHGMQMISFQVNRKSQVGSGGIQVIVEGRPSNSLPFTVRPGRVRFVRVTGDDVAGSGSWADPWRTITKACESLEPGDIAYVCDGVHQTNETGFDAAVNLGASGTAQNPKALVVYPGAVSHVGNPNLERAFHIWDPDSGTYSEYWILSKFTVTTRAVGIFAANGFRVVGNRLTAPTADEGMDGALYAIGNDVYLLGNELHNVGSSQSRDKMLHVVYVTGVRRDDPPRAATEKNREIAWNYLHDNGTNRGMQIYSEQANSAYLEQHRIHDNVIVNQRGDGILLGSYVTGENWLYNNLIVRAGLGPAYDDGTSQLGIHIDTGHMSVPKAQTLIHCYHNTLYGCGWPDAPSLDESGALLVTQEALGLSSVRFDNNLIYSTGAPYLARDSAPFPSGDHRNCWYGQGAAPVWDTAAIVSDPGFADVGAADFRLNADSPCLDAGLDLTVFVERDLAGVQRPQGQAVDVGAYERPAPVRRLRFGAMRLRRSW